MLTVDTAYPRVHADGRECVKDRLRLLREQAHLTQQELADRASVSRQTVLNLETGRQRDPVRGTIERIALVLETSPDYLLYGATDHDALAGLTPENRAIVLNIVDALRQAQMARLEDDEEHVAAP